MPGAAAAHTEKALPFQFNVPINKGYVDNKGKMHVLAIASDDSVDLQRDRMTDRALSSMAKQVESKLPFYETHGSVFPFGRTTKGKVIKTGTGYGLEVDVELDGDYPQARELYREVKAGNCRKQLSVGGELNFDVHPFRVLRTEKGLVREIDDVTLDHICTTRSGKAANPETGFVSAMMKSLDFGVEKGLLKVEEGIPEEGSTEMLNKDARVGVSLLSGLGKMARSMGIVPAEGSSEIQKRNLDGTGPRGEGPRSGRGLGNCPPTEEKSDGPPKSRSKPSPIFDANDKNVKDNKDHFPVPDLAHARNALARVMQYKGAPPWYTGDLKTLQEKVRSTVKAKFPGLKERKETREKAAEDIPSLIKAIDAQLMEDYPETMEDEMDKQNLMPPATDAVAEGGLPEGDLLAEGELLEEVGTPSSDDSSSSSSSSTSKSSDSSSSSDSSDSSSSSDSSDSSGSSEEEEEMVLPPLPPPPPPPLPDSAADVNDDLLEEVVDEEGKACMTGKTGVDNETPPLGVPESGEGSTGKKPPMTPGKKPGTPPPLPEEEMKTASLLSDIAGLEKKLQVSVMDSGEDISTREAINRALDVVRKTLAKEAGARGLQAEQWKGNDVAAPRDLSTGKGLPTEFPAKGSDADLAGSSVTDARKIPTYAEGEAQAPQAPDTGKDYMKIVELALRQAKELQTGQQNAAFGKGLEKATQQTVAAQGAVIAQSIQQAMEPFHQEFTDIAAKLGDVQKRLNSVEKTSQPSQSGPDANLNEGEEVIEKSQSASAGLWGGMIRKSAKVALSKYSTS